MRINLNNVCECVNKHQPCKFLIKLTWGIFKIVVCWNSTTVKYEKKESVNNEILF